jgi:hypothetical protein
LVDALDPAYVAARRVLLDALDALRDHRRSIILVGAQAVYLRTPESRLRAAPFTTDGDLAIDPRNLAAEPELERAMITAGFTLDPRGRTRQPGLWFKSVEVSGFPTDIEIDLMVPAAAIAHGSERGARLPDHSRLASRLAPGLEAALVDYSICSITALDPSDHRVVSCNVAGEVALIVAKLHKLNDRIEEPGPRQQRLSDKDAGDVVRLMMASDPSTTSSRLKQLADDPIAGDVVRTAESLLRSLFGARRAPGTVMAVRALATDLQAPQVETICESFVAEVLAS